MQNDKKMMLAQNSPAPPTIAAFVATPTPPQSLSSRDCDAVLSSRESMFFSESKSHLEAFATIHAASELQASAERRNLQLRPPCAEEPNDICSASKGPVSSTTGAMYKCKVAT